MVVTVAYCALTRAAHLLQPRKNAVIVEQMLAWQTNSHVLVFILASAYGALLTVVCCVRLASASGRSPFRS